MNCFWVGIGGIGAVGGAVGLVALFPEVEWVVIGFFVMGNRGLEDFWKK